MIKCLLLSLKMNKYIAGVKISNISKQEMLQAIDKAILNNLKGYIVTPYSEFIVTTKNDKEFLEILNESYLSLADGFGIALGLKYLSLRGNRHLDMIKCLFFALFRRKYFKGQIKEKLSGSEVIYDISELSAQKGYKIFMLGGFDFGQGNTGELSKRNLEEKYPNIKIVGRYSDGSSHENEDLKTIELINNCNPDIIFVAYGPVKQEKWMKRNGSKLNSSISIGLGGTFDFVSGEKKQVPKFIRKAGLEGVLRPFISEKGNPKLIWNRLKRAWGGIISYIFLLIAERKRTNSN